MCQCLWSASNYICRLVITGHEPCSLDIWSVMGVYFILYYLSIYNKDECACTCRHPYTRWILSHGPVATVIFWHVYNRISMHRFYKNETFWFLQLATAWSSNYQTVQKQSIDIVLRQCFNPFFDFEDPVCFWLFILGDN